MVCDLNGEWDQVFYGRGEYAAVSGRNIVKITQQGNSFEGIRMKDTSWFHKGTVVIEGELDGNGFKKLMYHGSDMSGPYEGKLSKDGNKIEFGRPTHFDMVFTRK